MDTEPQFAFEDSRRLTGPNRFFGVPAVVLTALSAAAGDPAAQSRWAARVRRLCAALGWPDPQPQAVGDTLAFAAPEALLFSATEVNEWAWERSAAEFRDLHGQGFTLLQPAADDVVALMAARTAREPSRPLQRLRAAAQQHALPFVVDDESLSIGAGSGSRTWPRAALPLPMDLPWAELHDVPTLLVTGSNGKTTTARLLAALFAASGRRAGCCSTEGVSVGATLLERGDYAGPAGARIVLRHPAVEAAVLETARGGLLRRGLAVRRADAAVVTNVSADHLGEYGIGSLDDIAEAKLVVAHAVAGGGTLVLNGSDDTLMAMADRLPHAAQARRALFALAHDHPQLVTLRLQGGSTCGAADGRLLLAEAGVEHDLGAVASLPLSVAGAAGYNVENIAAAVLAARAAGIGLAQITATIHQFGQMPQDNPGRLERWQHHGATVLVDYAHNPDGLVQLLRVARALRPQRLGLLLGQAGNRDDAAIQALARTAAGFAPDRVVIKELPLMLRGRLPGAVPALIEAGLLAAGLAPEVLQHEEDEELAANSLLAWAAPGDVIVLPVHTRSVRERLVEALGAG